MKLRSQILLYLGPFVLLDMLMPVMDGTECFYALKEVDQDVQVVVASGFTRDADLDGLREGGLAGFIRKPYSLVELSRALAGSLRKHSLHKRHNDGQPDNDHFHGGQLHGRQSEAAMQKGGGKV